MKSQVLHALAILITASIATSSCSAVVHPTPGPTATSTPAPRPTATPGPPPATGIFIQQLPDGSSLVTDMDHRYQFALGSDWQAFAPTSEGWAAVLADMPYDFPEITQLKDQAERLGPDIFRLFALNVAPQNGSAGHIPVLEVLATPASDGNCIPVDFNITRARKGLDEQGIEADAQFARNSHGVEIATLRVMESMDLEFYSGYYTTIAFNSAPSIIAVGMTAPPEIASQVLPEMEALTDTVELLPSGAASAEGVQSLQRPDGSTLVTDQELGYQFELEEIWHPIVLTADNASCLSMVVIEADYAFNPEFHRLLILSHDPKYVRQHVDTSYAVHVVVGRFDDFDKDLSMQEFLATRSEAVANVISTDVVVNSRGVEIGMLEADETAHGHTYEGLAVRRLIAHIRVNDVIIFISLAAPAPLDDSLREAFGTMVDSLELIPVAISATATP